MKKVVLASVCALLALAPAAHAQQQTVDDPTGEFSGTYQCGWETKKNEETGEYEYVLDENGNKKPVYCTQGGYVSVGTDGVVACNGNQDITRPDDGSPLQGYVWIGPDNAASNPTGEAPGGAAGAGNNHQTADGEPTGESPCPQQRASDEPPPQPKKAKAKSKKRSKAQRAKRARTTRR